MVFALICLRDFKKDLRVVCPHPYLNRDNYMRESDFHLAERREILVNIGKEMLQSPHKTDKTKMVVEETDWMDTMLYFQFIVMPVDAIVMVVNGAVY